MKDYSPAKKRVSVSVGESVRIIRELQELSPTRLTGILKCHPAVLIFPGWELPCDAAA